MRKGAREKLEELCLHYDVDPEAIFRRIIPGFFMETFYQKGVKGIKNNKTGVPLGNWRKKRLGVDVGFIMILFGGAPTFSLDRSIPPSRFVKSITQRVKINPCDLPLDKVLKPMSIDFSSWAGEKGQDFGVIPGVKASQVEKTVESLISLEKAIKEEKSLKSKEESSCKKSKKGNSFLSKKLATVSSYKQVVLSSFKDEFIVRESFEECFPYLCPEIKARTDVTAPTDKNKTYKEKLLEINPEVEGKRILEHIKNVGDIASRSLINNNLKIRKRQMDSIIKEEKRKIGLVMAEEDIESKKKKKKKELKAFKKIGSGFEKEIEMAESQLEALTERKSFLYNKFSALEEMESSPDIEDEKLNIQEMSVFCHLEKMEKSEKKEKYKIELKKQGVLKIKEGVLKISLVEDKSGSCEGNWAVEKFVEKRLKNPQKKKKVEKKKVVKGKSSRLGKRKEFFKKIGENPEEGKAVQKVIELTSNDRRRNQNGFNTKAFQKYWPHSMAKALRIAIKWGYKLQDKINDGTEIKSDLEVIEEFNEILDKKTSQRRNYKLIE